jgi:hypothetical protein
MMTPINYRYYVRGKWTGRPGEKPAITGAKFLQTLDLLSGIDLLFSGWQVVTNLKVAERRSATGGFTRCRAQAHHGDRRRRCRTQ